MKTIGFAFAVLSLLGTVFALAAGGESRFGKVTLALQNDHSDMAEVFAQSALTNLLEVYLAEADLARREQQQLAGEQKLAAWAVAVEQYSYQLNTMLEQIAAHSSVQIRSTSDSLAGVAVAGRYVILSHPRADQQAAFEQRIVSEFCARKNCDSLFSQVAAPNPVPVSAPVFTPDWSFGAAGPVCSSRAIQIQFASSGKLANSRSLCRQFFQEISSLATEIRWQGRQGVAVAWQHIAIRQTPHTPEHIVTLTLSGDVTLLPLPLLYSSKGLLVSLVPWLKAQAGGLAHPALLLDAEDYSWN